MRMGLPTWPDPSWKYHSNDSMLPNQRIVNTYGCSTVLPGDPRMPLTTRVKFLVTTSSACCKWITSNVSRILTEILALLWRRMHIASSYRLTGFRSRTNRFHHCRLRGIQLMYCGALVSFSTLCVTTCSVYVTFVHYHRVDCVLCQCRWLVN